MYLHRSGYYISYFVSVFSTEPLQLLSRAHAHGQKQGGSRASVQAGELSTFFLSTTPKAARKCLVEEDKKERGGKWEDRHQEMRFPQIRGRRKAVGGVGAGRSTPE